MPQQTCSYYIFVHTIFEHIWIKSSPSNKSGQNICQLNIFAVFYILTPKGTLKTVATIICSERTQTVTPDRIRPRVFCYLGRPSVHCLLQPSIRRVRSVQIDLLWMRLKVKSNWSSWKEFCNFSDMSPLRTVNPVAPTSFHLHIKWIHIKPWEYPQGCNITYYKAHQDDHNTLLLHAVRSRCAYALFLKSFCKIRLQTCWRHAD